VDFFPTLEWGKFIFLPLFIFTDVTETRIWTVLKNALYLRGEMCIRVRSEQTIFGYKVHDYVWNRLWLGLSGGEGRHSATIRSICLTVRNVFGCFSKFHETVPLSLKH
jgi:hypothetical protein